jgi:hypothetical protein
MRSSFRSLFRATDLCGRIGVLERLPISSVRSAVARRTEANILLSGRQDDDNRGGHDACRIARSAAARSRARCAAPKSCRSHSGLPPPQVLPCFEFSDRRKEPRAAIRRMAKQLRVDAGTGGYGRHQPADFHGRQRLWDLGSLVLANITTDSLGFSSLPGHVRRDPVDHWTMTLVKSGRIQTETSRGTFGSGPGRGSYPFAGAHVRRFGAANSDMLMLFVPRDFSVETAVTLGQSEFSTLSTGMGRCSPTI